MARLASAGTATLPGTGGAAGLAAEATAAAGGAAIRTTMSISGSESNIPNTKYVTYTRVNPATGEVYSGRTSGIGDPETIALARGAQQEILNKEGFAPPVVDRWSESIIPIRGREQQLIDYYGGAQSVGGTARNMINGVADLNPNRILYVGASISTFGPLPDNSPPRFRLGPP